MLYNTCIKFIKKYFTDWKYASRTIAVVNSIVIIIGGVYGYTQIQDIKNNQLDRKNDLSMEYYDRLNTGNNRKIYVAIENNKPLLANKMGKFNTDQLDDYLGDLHDVGAGLYADLLDNESTCSRFSDFAEKTYENKEIQEYLIEVRKIDPEYFLGFDDLYEFIKTCT